MLFLIERSKFDLKVVLFFLIITSVFFLIRSYYTSISLHYDFTNLVIDKRYLIINISILFVSTLLPLILIKFFLKKNMYNHKKVITNTNRGKKIIEDLFTYLFKNTKKYINKDILNESSKERAISDFISGMTDRYAINLHNNIK